MKTSAPTALSELERTERYLASDPNNPILLAKAMDLCLAAGRIEDAGRHAAYVRRTTNPHLQHRRAHVLIAQGELKEAALVLTRLLIQIADPNIAHDLALVHFRQGEFATARTVLREYVERSDAQPLSVTLYLRSLHQLGEINLALDVVDAHKNQCARSADFLGVASLLSLDADRLEQAASLSAAALATASDRRPLEALVTAGSVALGRGDTAAAKTMFKEAVAIQPAEGRSWAGLGMISLLAGDASAAKEQLQRAVKSMPGDVGSLQLLAWSQVLDRDLPAAKATLEQAIASDDAMASLHGSLALVLALQGDKAAAQASADRALQLDPDDYSAQYARAVLSGSQPDIEKLKTQAISMFAALGSRRGR